MSGTDPIPIARPLLGDTEARAVADAVSSRWVGQGPRVAEFERRLAERVGAPHAVAVASGTAALHLSLVAAGVGPGDEVIVPALSFIASANAVRMVGAQVVFADVDRVTFNLDLDDTARRITPRTRGILVVHQLGLPAHLHGFVRLAQQHGLLLLEDAACALGARYRGEPIGQPHGALACFSFHPRKVITTGEGGAITTADGDLTARLRSLRNHGAVVDSSSPAPGGVSYSGLGYNYRMSDLHAAVGLAQLERLDAILERRRELTRRYDERLGDHPALTIGETVQDATPSCQSYHVVLAEDAQRTPADIAARLAAQSIATRPGLTAIHLEPAYARPDGPSLPNTELLSRQGLFLPLYPELADLQVTRICDALLAALK